VCKTGLLNMYFPNHGFLRWGLREGRGRRSEFSVPHFYLLQSLYHFKSVGPVCLQILLQFSLMRTAEHDGRGNGIPSFLETQCSDLGPEIDFLDRGVFLFSVWVSQSLQQSGRIVSEMNIFIFKDCTKLLTAYNVLRDHF
jgi:hypothetical protein